MKTHVIRLDADDDTYSIRDKMNWSSSNRILLVVPRRNPPILNRLDLLLLKRKADQLGGQLALATRDSNIHNFAQEAGICTFRSVPHANRSTWQFLGKKNNANVIIREPKLINRVIFNRYRRPVVNHPAWLRIGIFVLAILSTISLILVFLPSAIIYYSPIVETQKMTIPMRASSIAETDMLSGILNAEVIRIDVEGFVESNPSSLVQVGKTYAKGTVRVTNDCEVSLTIPDHTVFLTSGINPVQFRSIETVQLAGGIGNSVDIQIQAVLAGSSGNVAKNAINTIDGGLGLRVEVTNPNAISSGYDVKVRGPSESDYNILTNQLLSSIKQDAITQIQLNYGKEYLVIDQTVTIDEIIDEERIPMVGTPAEKIQLKIIATVSVWVVKQQEIRNSVKSIMDGHLASDYRDVTDSLVITHENFTAMESQQSIGWQIQAQRYIRTKWDTQAAQASISGLPVLKAQKWLYQNLALQNYPLITMKPKFWPRLPFLTLSIKMVEND